MSTSCVIGLVECRTNDIILLEKTHDGFLENFKNDIEYALDINHNDIEDIANYLINHCFYEIAIYSHKYPHYAFIYISDYKEFLEIEINPNIEKICDCMPDILKVLEKHCKCNFKALSYFQPLT